MKKSFKLTMVALIAVSLLCVFALTACDFDDIDNALMPSNQNEGGEEGGNGGGNGGGLFGGGTAAGREVVDMRNFKQTAEMVGEDLLIMDYSYINKTSLTADEFVALANEEFLAQYEDGYSLDGFRRIYCTQMQEPARDELVVVIPACPEKGWYRATYDITVYSAKYQCTFTLCPKACEYDGEEALVVGEVTKR